MNYTFVTGASRGIGREVAKELASRGYFVFIAARDTKLLEQTKKEILESGGKAEIVKLDLLSLESIKVVPAIVRQKTDKLNILANIAGMYHDDEKHFFGIPFEEYPDDAIIKNVNAILVGHVLLTKYLAKFFDSSSSIVNMSGSFDEGETGVISDFLTKKGMELFTQQLPLELKDKGVRVNALRPDFVFTENVRKFFPDVTQEEALDPKAVAKKIVDVAENTKLNGEIIDIKRQKK